MFYSQPTDGRVVGVPHACSHVCKVKAEAEQASEHGYQNLQDGFDALVQCQQSVQKLCRSFPRGS
eukprot:7436996-Alexandrium_andersonii.AAC.1